MNCFEKYIYEFRMISNSATEVVEFTFYGRKESTWYMVSINGNGDELNAPNNLLHVGQKSNVKDTNNLAGKFCQIISD